MKKIVCCVLLALAFSALAAPAAAQAKRNPSPVLSQKEYQKQQKKAMKQQAKQLRKQQKMDRKRMKQANKELKKRNKGVH